MLTQTWVDGIEAAVVMASLTTTWWALRKPRAKAKPGAQIEVRPIVPGPVEAVPARAMLREKPTGAKPPVRGVSQRPWQLYRNEAEIARRDALAAEKKPASAQEKSSAS